MPKPILAWLRLANYAYGFVSLIILVGVILAFSWPGFPISEIQFSSWPGSGLLAFLSVLYSFLSFRYIADAKPKLSGVLSFLLYSVAAFGLVAATKQPESLLPLLMLITITSAMHGWAMWTLSLVATSVFFVGVEVGQLDRSLENPIMWLAIIGGGGILSIILVELLELKHSPRKKRVRKSKASAAGSGQIASDILINAIADGVAIINTSGQINIFNPSAQKITGWSAEEARGLDYRSVIIFTDDKGAIYPDERNPIQRAFTSGEPVQDDNAQLQTRSKKGIEIDVLASPIKQGEKVVAVVCIFRDVSKLRTEERQRAEFISTASHEMRTPVAAIEGYLALALNEKVSKIDSGARGYLEKAHSSTKHLGKLFQDLLTAAKSEDGRLTNNPEVIEVGQLLTELIEGVQFTAEKKGLMLKSDFGVSGERQVAGAPVMKQVAYVLADAERLREVITNFFDNAVKYTEEGSITIGMHADEKNVIIKVADTGPGIPKEDIPHLFQKFYRVDNSATRQIGGTGLGLFISRKIIELYDGRVWVESELDKGSTFYISIPRLSADRAQELLKQQATQLSPLDSSASVVQSAAASPPASVAPENKSG